MPFAAGSRGYSRPGAPGRLSYRLATISAVSSIRDVGVALDSEQFRIDGMKTCSSGLFCTRADGFTAAADGNFDAIKDHRARGPSAIALKAGRALAIDGRSRHGHRQSRAQTTLYAQTFRAGGPPVAWRNPLRHLPPRRASVFGPATAPRRWHGPTRSPLRYY